MKTCKNDVLRCRRLLSSPTVLECNVPTASGVGLWWPMDHGFVSYLTTRFSLPFFARCCYKKRRDEVRGVASLGGGSLSPAGERERASFTVDPTPVRCRHPSTFCLVDLLSLSLLCLVSGKEKELISTRKIPPQPKRERRKKKYASNEPSLDCLEYFVVVGTFDCLPCYSTESYYCYYCYDDKKDDEYYYESSHHDEEGSTLIEESCQCRRIHVRR